MAKEKWKVPPLYIPSSGSIVSVKLRVSSGFGKASFIVLGRESSERSVNRIVSDSSMIVLEGCEGGLGKCGARYERVVYLSVLAIARL